jgi:hypothetical protein
MCGCQRRRLPPRKSRVLAWLLHLQNISLWWYHTSTKIYEIYKIYRERATNRNIGAVQRPQQRAGLVKTRATSSAHSPGSCIAEPGLVRQ